MSDQKTNQKLFLFLFILPSFVIPLPESLAIFCPNNVIFQNFREGQLPPPLSWLVRLWLSLRYRVDGCINEAEAHVQMWCQNDRARG